MLFRSQPVPASTRPDGVRLNIPGVSRGFGGQAGRGISVFKAGDAVRHRVFGLGTVLEVIGAGAQQRVRIQFDDGSERSFAVAAAPIAKVER